MVSKVWKAAQILTVTDGAGNFSLIRLQQRAWSASTLKNLIPCTTLLKVFTNMAGFLRYWNMATEDPRSFL